MAKIKRYESLYSDSERKSVVKKGRKSIVESVKTYQKSYNRLVDVFNNFKEEVEAEEMVDALEKAIDTVEGAITDLIQSVGATNPAVAELIDAVSDLESDKEVEEDIAEIEAEYEDMMEEEKKDDKKKDDDDKDDKKKDDDKDGDDKDDDEDDDDKMAKARAAKKESGIKPYKFERYKRITESNKIKIDSSGESQIFDVDGEEIFFKYDKSKKDYYVAYADDGSPFSKTTSYIRFKNISDAEKFLKDAIKAEGVPAGY